MCFLSLLYLCESAAVEGNVYRLFIVDVLTGHAAAYSFNGSSWEKVGKWTYCTPSTANCVWFSLERSRGPIVSCGFTAFMLGCVNDVTDSS